MIYVVPTKVAMKLNVLREMAPYILSDLYRPFRVSCCINLVCYEQQFLFSETSTDVCRSTQSDILEHGIFTKFLVCSFRQIFGQLGAEELF
jgi:hypothetical protein